jgi:hypothetical protein
MYKILLLLLTITLCFPETILIPEDFGTIQEGIDASVDGDTVLIADFNDDGIVDILDIVQIVNYILEN